MKTVVTFEVAVTLTSEANGSHSRSSHWSEKSRRVRWQRETLVTHLRTLSFMPFIRFELPKPPRKYAVARWAPPYEPPLHIVITRCAPRALDDDNATRSAKAVRDQLAELLGLDDRDPRVTWEVKQEQRPAKRGPLVRVEILAPGA